MMFWKVIILANALLNLYLMLYVHQMDIAVSHLYQVLTEGLELAKRQHGGGKHEKEALYDSDKG